METQIRVTDVYSREQLQLRDDPSFFPDIAFRQLEDELQAMEQMLRHQSPSLLPVSMSPEPSVDEESVLQHGEILLPQETSSIIGPTTSRTAPGSIMSWRPEGIVGHDDFGGLDTSADFGFDELGNLYLSPAKAPRHDVSQPPFESDDALVQRVLQEHTQGVVRGKVILGLNSKVTR